MSSPADESIASPTPSDPTRIAFCITELDPGGAERALVELVTRLDRREWDPLVISLSSGGMLAERLRAAGVPVTGLGAVRVRQPTFLPHLVHEIRRWRPALLQTWLFHANLAGRLAGRIARVPRIVSGIRVAERRGRWRLRADRATEWMVDHHVCVSRDVAEFSVAEGRLPPSKVSVIPNGVDVDRFAAADPADLSALGIPPGSPVMLVVGRLDPQKDPLAALEVAHALRTPHPSLHTVYAGEGPLRGALEQRCRSLGMESRVHVLGWRPDVPSLLRAATLLVLPSRWEGMPNVVLEAMAAGTPVVAARVEGLTELIESELNGWLVPPGSVEALSTAVGRVLNDSQLAITAALRSQAIARQRFTIAAAVEQYVVLYRKLLVGRP